MIAIKEPPHVFLKHSMNLEINYVYIFFQTEISISKTKYVPPTPAVY